MIKDRRSASRIIPIEFIAKEEFQMYPQADYMTITLVTDGIWEFILNGQEERREAPFILCLNDRDVFTLLHKSRAAAKTFLFYPTFLNSSLTKEALLHDNFEKIEDMHDSNLIQTFLQRNENYRGLFALNAPSAMQINTWLSIMGAECMSQSDGRWTCRIRRYLLQVLCLLEDEFLASYEKRISKKQPIEYALEYIHSNYHRGLSLDGISKYVGLNRTTLNKHCKEKTGMTIIQYLNHYRIRMAEEALCHTNLTLSEIAVCCGYNYESYFIKNFAEKHGISPTEFRRKRWGEE